MREFGARLTLRDQMSNALAKSVKQMHKFSLQIHRTRRNIQSLGNTSVSPSIRMPDNISGAVRRMRRAINSVGNEPIMTRVKVEDRATKNVEKIKKKLQDLKAKVTAPVIRLKDMATEHVNRIKSRLREIATTFTPIVKLRNLASQGLAKLKNSLISAKNFVATPVIKLKDFTVKGINRIRVAFATVRKLVATPIIKVRDFATKAVANIKIVIHSLGRIVASPALIVKDLASVAIKRVGGKLATVGRKVARPFIKLRDKVASSKLAEILRKLKRTDKEKAKPTVSIRDRASAALSKIGGKIKTFAKVSAVALGAAAVASVKVAADFESGMSKVSAISGASGTELDKLSAKAKEMGAKTKFSAKEATDAYQYMAMAGWKSGDMLNGIEPIMKLAGASGEDLATTSDIVTDALTAFGMKSKDTSRLADVMAAASSNSNTNVSMLGESFKYAAPVAGALGFSVEDTSLALGLMANSGIKASSAGTALRSMFTNMAKPTKQSSQALDALGLSLTDNSGKMKPFNEIMLDMRKGFSGLTKDQKASYAASIAGKTGMSGLLAVVNSSDKDFNKLASAIKGSNGACENMYDTANDNLSGQLTILKSTVESIGIAFGEKLTPAVKGAVKVIQSIGEKISGILDPTTSAGKKFDEMGSKIVGTVKHVVKQAGVLAEPFSGFADGMPSAETVVTDTCNGVVAGIDALVPMLLPAMQAISDCIVPVVDTIKGIVAAAIPVVTGAISVAVSFISGILPTVGSVFQTVGGAIQKVLSMLGNHMGLFQTIVQTVVTVVGAVWEALAPVISTAVDLIITVVDGMLTGIEAVFNFLAPYISQIWRSICGFFSSASSTIRGIISTLIGVFNSLRSAVSSVFGSIRSTISSVCGAVAGAISGVVDKISDFVDKIGDAISKAKDFAGNVAKNVTTKVKNAVPRFAYGKNRVPYNDYPARLHEGERVLTRNQADQYDRVMGTRGIPNRAMGTGAIARGNALTNARQEGKFIIKQEVKRDGGSKNYTINFYESHFESKDDVDNIVNRMVKRLEAVEGNVT